MNQLNQFILENAYFFTLTAIVSLIIYGLIVFSTWNK